MCKITISKCVKVTEEIRDSVCGINVNSEALSQVIITKLSFAVPSHPLIAARMKQRLWRQLFCRLQSARSDAEIPSGSGTLDPPPKNDRGRITVLDPRLVTKHYGRVFIDALPRRDHQLKRAYTIEKTTIFSFSLDKKKS